MTHYQHATVRRVVRRLQPSPASLAAATAVVDPGLLLQLQAVQRERTLGTPTRRRDGSDVERRGSRRASAAPCPA